MKRIVISLLTILLTTTICSSQITSHDIKSDTIVSITSEQLKYANLIFVEHEKLLIENDLLNTQIQSYKIKLDLSEKIDSLRVSQIVQYEEAVKSSSNQIKDLNRELAWKNKIVSGLKIGCITVSIGTVLLLLLK